MTGLSSDFVLPTIMGFIARGVVVNSLKEEIPEKERDASFLSSSAATRRCY
jgi:hypothetical protein